MGKEFETINLDSRSKSRLEYISKITGKAQSRILADFIECVFAVGVNYEKMSFDVIDQQLENRVIITMHGLRNKSALTFGRASSFQEVQDITARKIHEDLAEKEAEDAKKEIHIKRDADAPPVDSDKHSGSSKFYRGLLD
jgi:hypothetical protein